MTVDSSGAAISEVGSPATDGPDAPGLADRERTVKSPGVPLSYERLCLKVRHLERILRARDDTLHMIEAERTRLVDELKSQLVYTRRILLRTRKAEAKLRDLLDIR